MSTDLTNCNHLPYSNGHVYLQHETHTSEMSSKPSLKPDQPEFLKEFFQYFSPNETSSERKEKLSRKELLKQQNQTRVQAEKYEAGLKSLESENEKSEVGIWDTLNQLWNGFVSQLPSVSMARSEPLCVDISQPYSSITEKYNTVSFPSNHVAHLSANKKGSLNIVRLEKNHSAEPCKALGSYRSTCRDTQVSYDAEEDICTVETYCKISQKEQINSQLNKIFTEMQKVDQALNEAATEDSKEKYKRNRTELQQKENELLKDLIPGEIIAFKNQKIEVMSEADLSKDYPKAPIQGFNKLAKDTGGIMGFARDREDLSPIMKKMFAHMLGQVKEGQPLNVAVLFDSTRSMEPYLDEAKRTLGSAIEELCEKDKECQMALLQYRDDDKDSYGILNQVEADFSSNLQQVASKVQGIFVHGGGDDDEAVLDALLAAQKLSWKKGAHQVVLLIGDGAPHSETKDPQYNKKSISDVIATYTETSLIIYTIAAQRWVRI